MKNYLNVIVWLLVSMQAINSFGQERTEKWSHCGQDQLTEWRMNADPAYKSAQDNINEKLRQLARYRETLDPFSKNAVLSSGGTYHIPVVFHIIISQNTLNSLPNGPGWSDEYRMSQAFYNGGASAVSNRVVDQLNRLNAEFSSSSADIVFCKAQNAPPNYSWQQITDPLSGTSFQTEGVTFTVDDNLAEIEANDQAKITLLEQTLPFNNTGSQRYLNVYVTENLRLFNDPRPGFARPASGPGDGIYLTHFVFGDNQNSNPNYFSPASGVPGY
ncbi:MAG: hypothetical protein WBA74_23375, partial [Cyclobacteriaceae bacterium]